MAAFMTVTMYLKCNILKERQQLSKLTITGVHEPALYRNTILQLVAKRLGGIINNEGFTEVPAQDVQILDVVTMDTYTVLAE